MHNYAKKKANLCKKKAKKSQLKHFIFNKVNSFYSIFSSSIKKEDVFHKITQDIKNETKT